MNILYIAKHDSGGNDDEGAITHALTLLGHNVERLRENRGHIAYKVKCDFALFHHWQSFDLIDRIKIPKVCWCFDLIDWPNDPTLEPRNRKRRAWAAAMAQACDLFFLTDGDWASRGGKHVWLPQGFDERLQHAPPCERDIDILFTGISAGGGIQRESFVSELRERWGDKFHHVTKGAYRERLAELVSRAKVVVCPDAPVTDRYWSNRVWNAAGLGANVIHAKCQGLHDVLPLVFQYASRGDLHSKLEWMLTPKHKTYIDNLARLTRQDVLANHTYRHRCETLVNTVKERLCHK